MTIKLFLEKVYLRMPIRFILLVEVLSYWWKLCRYNASIRTDSDMRKMQYTILRENHVIEKGMSMKHPRKGFGQEKVKRLLYRLSLYKNRYGLIDAEFLKYPLATVHSYIEYQKDDGVEICSIEEQFLRLCSQAKISIEELIIPSGGSLFTREELAEAARGDFSSLLHSRHSIRYFSMRQPERDVIDHALQLASRTPSACNRQAWHTHVFFGEDVHRLLDMQGGCNGFSHDIPCCIVVSSDMRGFLSYEPFQCYIDGGLYAQNLINSLHYLGLGTIPLSCGFLNYRLSRMQKLLHIPQNEVMIAIIGIGYMCDEMKIARSTRKPISWTNTYHPG